MSGAESTLFEWAGALIALGLAVYLFIVLLFPEDFS
jgi:K+-transporting ATPase KdpF subunit